MLRHLVLLFSQLLFDLCEHLGFFGLHGCLLLLKVLLCLFNFLLLEFLGLILDLLDLGVHLIRLLLVDDLDLGDLLKLDLSHVLVDLLESGLVVFLEFVLLLLDRCPDFLDSLLELFFELLKLVFVEEGCR